jgi:hypothetical protein
MWPWENDHRTLRGVHPKTFANRSHTIIKLVAAEP